jgi:NADH-quinone oxidoreductase subunit B
MLGGRRPSPHQQSMVRGPFLGPTTLHRLRSPPTEGATADGVSVFPVRWLDWYGDGSLHVCEIALACCALELEAAAFDAGAGPALPAPGGRVVVVVSGTVTDRLAPAVTALVDACAERSGGPPVVVALGACASSGGPYWDSYAVTKGVDALLPVDVYVPGCPPPPEALQRVLDELRPVA